MTWRAATAAFLLLLTAATVPTVASAQWRRGGGPRLWEAAQDRGPYGRFGGGGRGAYGFGGAPPPAYAPPRAYGPGPGVGYGGGGWRRGQVLPPAYRGAYVPDPGRYHLRAAPPGYGWVGDGRDAYLTQRSTGLVLDHVPGAYDPAPAWRRGGPSRGRYPR